MATVLSTTNAEQANTKSTWALDTSHTSVQFAAKHMMITTVRGHLGEATGSIVLNGKDFTKSDIDVKIDLAGLTTRDEKRDAHLRSGDFFDTETYPTATFKSNRIEKAGNDSYKVVGDLTIHGITKEVMLDTDFEGFNTTPWGAQVLAFTAHTKINRKDFNLNWNVALETGGVLVADNIKLEIDVEAIKQ
jgi:polyisoprenoid-binding protein YceI